MTTNLQVFLFFTKFLVTFFLRDCQVGKTEVFQLFNKIVKMSRTKDHRFFTKMSNYAESKSPENFAHALQLTWWRLHAGGGFHKGSGGRQTSKSAQNCLRAYPPACVKPLVIGWRSSLISIFISKSSLSRNIYY